MRKNYLRDLESSKSEQHSREASFLEYWQALKAFLRKPKTLFDLKDRSILLVLMLAVIILLQKVVEYVSN
ncbi:MAG: hypothetical protein ACI3WS_06095 [Phascolarctobacterium sp.]